ncbi:EthD domain-containing protein [Pseudomonas graminis]|uniref:Methylmuconolactone methyl-isomerase n=1 Tax=Pseudomonas graminis TaxID=158627 RepID=A0A1I0GND9_9PSED|nr:EthD domain-containing protein [Pseudomonas graminis]SET72812.1 Methylmuconolactone methyl-isomerase [Pseudomonas graminis]
MIEINSYTTVKRRERVPHDVFAHYWRDVHGPLCSRLPGLGLYIQHHFSRQQDAHLWPLADGISEIQDYELDGGVEIGFESAADQKQFQEASPILFSDEQNMFDETLAYALPQGSLTLTNALADERFNGTDTFDRIHIHFSPRETLAQLQAYLKSNLGPLLAGAEGVVKVCLHLCEPFENDGQHPPAPNVAHFANKARAELVVLEIAFTSPLARRRFFQSDAFQNSLPEQSKHIAQLKAFAVSGLYTYVRDKSLTTAGLRGSRAAELIEYLGAVNQVQPDVKELMLKGTQAS